MNQRELVVSLVLRELVSNSAACREVGVDRRTGTRWRNGRSIPRGRWPLDHSPVLSPSQHDHQLRNLSQNERVVIADVHRAGPTSRAIGDAVPAAQDLGPCVRRLQRRWMSP